jgi:hypothetical protein
MLYAPAWDMTIAEIGFNVTTLIAGANARVVVYDELPVGDALEGWPGQLMYVGANQSCATTGFKTDLNPVANAAHPTAGQPLKFLAGHPYWIGVHHSSTATLRAISATGMRNLGYNSSTGTQSMIVQRTVGYNSLGSNLPATFGMVTGDRAASNVVTEVRWKVG